MRRVAGRVACVSVALVFATACRAVPPPPYPLAFALDGRSPRLLQTAEETTVPLVVTNTGQRTWDPERMHVSYHWLWLVPRELARRSRTVPYHDGIRTDLERPVAPGAPLTVQGRLLAPTFPGLYWLQWDMVEEGVTWFAQVAPRQSRTLVLVVPPPVWVFAPLPLLVALWGVYRLRRSIAERRGRPWSAPDRAEPFGPPSGPQDRQAPPLRPLVATADVWWCAATLAIKPLIVTHDALLEPTAVSYWLILVVALLIPIATMLILPRRIRPWVLLAIGVFGSLVILGDDVYYRFFGDVLSTPAMLAVNQTAHVWGSIRSLFTPGLVWLIVDWPFALWLVVELSRRGEAALSLRARAVAAAITVAALAVAGLALSAPQVLASTPLDQMFRDRSVVEQLGPFAFHLYDTMNYVRGRWLRPTLTDAQVEDALSWFVERAPARAGAGSAAFGAARGKNLIVVQVESLQDFAVDLQVNGQEVMPHLRRWTADSLRFTNVTDQTGEGRTSDAEFTTLTSLLPLAHGAVAFRFPGNHYVGLPRVLTEHGYATLSAVPFEPGFWNRQVMHPSYGFQQSLFEPAFEMTEQIGWGLNDHDFLQQMVPRLERLPKPFAAWLITLSLHHPFDDFPDRHKVLKLGALEGTSFGNYLHTMRFFDAALDDFKAALVRNGLFDGSVLVVFGDHDAGFVRDQALSRAIGIGADDVAWALNDRVPLFIHVGAAAADADGLSGARSGPAGQTDLAPTLLGLLGIDPAPLPYVGRNLLGISEDRPLPRPYGDWLDASHLFLARGPASVCYDVARRAPAPASDCATEDASARRTRELSRLLITSDLQERLRVRLNTAAR